MIPRPLTRAEVRQIDRRAIDEFAMSGLVLMENAGREAAAVIAARYGAGKVLVLCGKGNNGGDGYVIARHLQLAQAHAATQADAASPAATGGQVRVLSLIEPAELAGDAAANHRIAALSGLAIATVTDPQQLAAAIGTPDVIVDCLLGTGAMGQPREPFAEAIRLANQAAARRVAIDVPSGLDVDSGVAASPTFAAELTLTMVAAKVGFATAAAAAVLGEVVVIPIGVPLRLLQQYR